KFIESDGRDLLQGVVAGGMLYSHGMELAFDCLALDRAHREQLEAMNDGAIPRMAKRAGEMLLEQAGKLRSLFKDRRKKPITLLKSYLKSKVTGDDARRETDRGPNTTGDMK